MFKSKLVSFIYTPKVLRFAKYLSLHTRGKKKSTSAGPDVFKQEEKETDSGFIQISREFYASVVEAGSYSLMYIFWDVSGAV